MEIVSAPHRLPVEPHTNQVEVGLRGRVTKCECAVTGERFCSFCTCAQWTAAVWTKSFEMNKKNGGVCVFVHWPKQTVSPKLQMIRRTTVSFPPVTACFAFSCLRFPQHAGVEQRRKKMQKKSLRKKCLQMTVEQQKALPFHC